MIDTGGQKTGGRFVAKLLHTCENGKIEKLKIKNKNCGLNFLEVSFDKACVNFIFDKKVVRKNCLTGGDCCLYRLNNKF